MPVVLEKSVSATKKLGIWQITESVESLQALFSEQDIPGHTTEKRMAEALSSRLLLNYMLGPGSSHLLRYDDFGKPYLAESNTAISFSHSHQYVAVLTDTTGQGAGVDIEQVKPRIANLAAKFINSNDRTSLDNDVESLHLVWSAKEVLYKIYGRKEVDFKAHLSVVFNGDRGMGHIRMPHFNLDVPMEYFMFNGFIVAFNT